MEVSTENSLHFRNSVVERLDLNTEIQSEPGNEGAIELERCAFWGLDPISNGRSMLGGTTASIYLNHTQAITARSCYFASPCELLVFWDKKPVTHPIHWTGEGNVFAIPRSFTDPGDVPTLAAWQQRVQQEKDSATEASPLFAPDLWKLAPGSPGAGAASEGGDLGADVTQVAGANESNSVSK